MRALASLSGSQISTWTGLTTSQRSWSSWIEGRTSKRSLKPKSLSCIRDGMAKSQAFTLKTTKFCLMMRLWLTTPNWFRRTPVMLRSRSLNRFAMLLPWSGGAMRLLANLTTKCSKSSNVRKTGYSMKQPRSWRWTEPSCKISMWEETEIDL